MDQGSNIWIVNSGTDAAPKWRWEYDLKDHLGNVRVVLGDSTAIGYARVLQQNHYYPFGMRMSEISTSLADTSNNYLYNGKEFQDDFGLNWYDYGARFYDPALGRWHSVDPLAEKEYNLSYSPYTYCINNPILLIDPNGEDWFLNNQTGEVIFAAGQNTLTDEYLSNVGVNASISDYENIGSDEMFDTEDSKVGDTGVEFTYMSAEKAEGFMTGKGYEKLTKRTSEEIEYTSVDYEPDGKIETTSSRNTITDKIVYEKIKTLDESSGTIEIQPSNIGYMATEEYKSTFMLSTHTNTKVEVMPFNAQNFRKANSLKQKTTSNAYINLVLNVIDKTLEK